METLDWLSNNYMTLVWGGGVVLLLVAVVYFFFKTAWGHWHKGSGKRYDRLRNWDASHKHYE